MLELLDNSFHHELQPGKSREVLRDSRWLPTISAIKKWLGNEYLCSRYVYHRDTLFRQSCLYAAFIVLFHVVEYIKC